MGLGSGKRAIGENKSDNLLNGVTSPNRTIARFEVTPPMLHSRGPLPCLRTGLGSVPHHQWQIGLHSSCRGCLMPLPSPLATQVTACSILDPGFGACVLQSCVFVPFRS